MQAIPATPTELASILAPFVDARLNLERDASGYVIERTRFVDIEYGVCSRVDADIRGVGPDGIRSFFYDRSDLIAWADVSRITIRTGNCSVSYRVVASHRMAA